MRSTPPPASSQTPPPLTIEPLEPRLLLNADLPFNSGPFEAYVSFWNYNDGTGRVVDYDFDDGAPAGDLSIDIPESAITRPGGESSSVDYELIVVEDVPGNTTVEVLGDEGVGVFGISQADTADLGQPEEAESEGGVGMVTDGAAVGPSDSWEFSVGFEGFFGATRPQFEYTARIGLGPFGNDIEAVIDLTVGPLPTLEAIVTNPATDTEVYRGATVYPGIVDPDDLNLTLTIQGDSEGVDFFYAWPSGPATLLGSYDYQGSEEIPSVPDSAPFLFLETEFEASSPGIDLSSPGIVQPTFIFDPGATASLDIPVWNTGQTDAGASTGQLWIVPVGGDPLVDGTLLASDALPALAALGGNENLEFSFTTPTTPGEYELAVVIDALGQVTEDNEFNNILPLGAVITPLDNAALAGTWQFAAEEAFGEITFDGAGLITGGSFTDADNDSFTITGGTYAAGENGLLTATLLSDDPTAPVIPISGAYSQNDDVAAFNFLDPGSDETLIVAVKSTGGGFSDSDLSGEWFLAGLGVVGTINFNGSGGITGGSVTVDDGAGSITGGSYSVNADGSLTATINTDDPDTPSISFAGEINESGDLVLLWVEALPLEDETVGRFLLTESSGAFTEADVPGIWYLNGPAEGGQIVLTPGGSVFSGSYVDSSGNRYVLDAGSWTINAQGEVTLDATFTNVSAGGDDTFDLFGVMSTSKQNIVLYEEPVGGMVDFDSDFGVLTRSPIPAPTPPDLTVQTVAGGYTPGVYLAGETFTVTPTALNAGLGPVTDSFNIRVFLTQDTTIGNGDDIVLGSAVVPPVVNAGEEVTLTAQNFALPSVGSPESYYVGWTVDIDGEVAEGDENNQSGLSSSADVILVPTDTTRFFDPNFYLDTNPDVQPLIDAGDYRSAFGHFFRVGQFSGLAPNYLFDVDYYAAMNPDAVQDVSDGVYDSLFEHFERVGEEAGRSPSPFFDAAYYLGKYADVQNAVAGGTLSSAYAHYYDSGEDEGREATPWFNTDYYRGQRPDVAAAVDSDAFPSELRHFIRFDQREGENPNPLFSNTNYRNANPDVAAVVDAGGLPSAFYHALRFGQFEDRDVSAYFDPDWYLDTYEEAATAVSTGAAASAIDHYLRTGARAGLSPSPWFDEAEYQNRYPDIAAVVASGTFSSGFEHYLRFGVTEQRDTARFEESTYLLLYPDIQAAVTGGVFQSGFEHFLLSGRAEGRRPVYYFDEAFYLTTYTDIADAVSAGVFASGLEHYLLAGANEGRDPNPYFSELDYRSRYPDIANAVAGGVFRSGYDHYRLAGLGEQRVTDQFDEAFYLANNPDIANLVSTGVFPSGFYHYVLYGAAEGRPSKAP